MATYAIGDVQGCARTLDRLLASLPLDRRADRLWFVGDLVNRGPDSAEALRIVRRLGGAAHAVLGNHDLHALARAEGLGREKRRDTLRDLLSAPDREELFGWLGERPLLVRDGRTALVHAGVPPRWSLDDAAAFAGEAGEALRGPRRRDVLDHWARGEDRAPETTSGPRRAAAAMVALTTLRTLDPSGAPDASFKGAPEDAPPGRVPWFRAKGRRTAGDTLVFGHWASLGLRIEPGIVATDTGCVWGKRLTAVRLEDRAVFSQPCADPVAGD